MSDTPSVHESRTENEEKDEETRDSLLQAEEYATPSKHRDDGLDISARDRSAETLEITNETKEFGDESVIDEITINKGSDNKETITLNIRSDDEGDDTPTLPLHKKKKMLNKSKEKPPSYIFPISRLRKAWTESSNILDFSLKATGIIFSTLGWLCCVGGIPLMSLAMLIIGSLYIGMCNVQPNIPIYLVVAGAFGTLQHFVAVWTRYIPKDSEGRMKIYRSYCRVVDCTVNIFLFIWFVLGCIWVYGVPENIDFRDSYKDEYCDQTVYYFAFWMLNISFILMALLIVGTLFCIICIVISPKGEEYVH